jgi:ABC-type transport system involved in multi-copper enzyme maturation permease subunit
MINRAVAWHSFHQHHWIRLSLLGLTLLFVFLFSNTVDFNRFPLLVITPFLVWLLGSGIIGRDMSSGVAHLLFTRPLTRMEYVLTKWVSLTAAVVGFQFCILIVWCLGKLYYGKAPQLSAALFQDLGLGLWMAGTLSTTVILFSTIMTGLGDLALLLYAHVVLLILNVSPLKVYIPDFDKCLKWISYELWPGGNTGFQFFSNRELVTGDFITDTVVAGVFLASAVYLMSRKDIGYTSD